MPELAKSAELLLEPDGSGVILVDGEEFPLHVLAGDIAVEALGESCHVLRLGVLVDGPVRVNTDLVDEYEVR